MFELGVDQWFKRTQANLGSTHVLFHRTIHQRLQFHTTRRRSHCLEGTAKRQTTGHDLAAQGARASTTGSATIKKCVSFCSVAGLSQTSQRRTTQTSHVHLAIAIELKNTCWYTTGPSMGTAHHAQETFNRMAWSIGYH